MRKINGHDVFEAMRLIQKSGLKDKLAPVVAEIAKKGTAVTDAGVIGILTMIEVFGTNGCERMIWEWLSGPLEVTPEEISVEDLGALADHLEALGRENNVQHFFAVLSGLLTKRP